MEQRISHNSLEGAKLTAQVMHCMIKNWMEKECVTYWLGTLFRGKPVTLLFLTTGCHLIANPQRVWKAESRCPSTVTQPLVPRPLSPCPLMVPWPGTATAPLLGSPPWPDGHSHQQQHSEESTCAGELLLVLQEEWQQKGLSGFGKGSPRKWWNPHPD